MTISVALNPSDLPKLLELFQRGGKATRLRLSPHILEHEKIPLAVLLTIYHYVDTDTWVDNKLFKLKKRLLWHKDDVVLYKEFKQQIKPSNEIQKRIVFETLVAIGNHDVLSDVIPYTMCSKPEIGFPAINLVTALATPQDLPELRKIDMQNNSNEVMRESMKELIGQLSEG